ncbi:MAG: UDP-N-acetylmuramoyl-L-alanine--D-glutamate ligase [Elusimicrobiota bacterium]|nr:UDP-N-acetylmuramoyl-L-alanine--D-glutamate ligase [Elusimicrobiota bacterium]
MEKKLTVLGLGKSGVAAANLGVKLGYKVFASDSEKERAIKNLNKKVETEFGTHSDKVLDVQVIVKSPGIHRTVPIIKKALAKKIKVVSELRFALDHSEYSKLVALTGTNGKTTTTDLLFKIIKSFHKDTIVCGNIGFPLSDKSLKTSPKTIIVLETSSYQLEDTPNLKPFISVALNISKDHIDHHGSMNNYVKAKKIVFANQTSADFAVLNFDDKEIMKISKTAKASKIFFSKKPFAPKPSALLLKKGTKNAIVFYDEANGGQIVFQTPSKTLSIKPKIKIAGWHNIENILAASAAAFCLGVAAKNIVKTISAYKGVRHRIEFIKSLNGAAYYNDSKATNIDSTRVALNAFDGNIWLIMGGQDKKIPYTSLANLIKAKVKGILLVGEAAPLIKRDLAGAAKFYDCGTVDNAAKKAFTLARKGDIVLLSPACASWDQFKNFEERGDMFRNTVESL